MSNETLAIAAADAVVGSSTTKYTVSAGTADNTSGSNYDVTYTLTATDGYVFANGSTTMTVTITVTE